MSWASATRGLSIQERGWYCTPSGSPSYCTSATLRRTRDHNHSVHQEERSRGLSCVETRETWPTRSMHSLEKILEHHRGFLSIPTVARELYQASLRGLWCAGLYHPGPCRSLCRWYGGLPDVAISFDEEKLVSQQVSGLLRRFDGTDASTLIRRDDFWLGRTDYHVGVGRDPSVVWSEIFRPYSSCPLPTLWGEVWSEGISGFGVAFVEYDGHGCCEDVSLWMYPHHRILKWRFDCCTEIQRCFYRVPLPAPAIVTRSINLGQDALVAWRHTSGRGKSWAQCCYLKRPSKRRRGLANGQQTSSRQWPITIANTPVAFSRGDAAQPFTSWRPTLKNSKAKHAGSILREPLDTDDDGDIGDFLDRYPE